MDNEIIIRTGDKVITADGLIGRVIYVAPAIRYGFHDVTYQINCRTKTAERITYVDMQNNFQKFYLIGKNFFGNKISTDEMERRIAEQKEVIEREKEKLDALRKQLWTLNEQMVPDWREREEARHKAAEERKVKKSAEQPDN